MMAAGQAERDDARADRLGAEHNAGASGPRFMKPFQNAMTQARNRRWRPGINTNTVRPIQPVVTWNYVRVHTLTDEKVLIPAPAPSGALYFHELIVEPRNSAFCGTRVAWCIPVARKLICPGDCAPHFIMRRYIPDGRVTSPENQNKGGDPAADADVLPAVALCVPLSFVFPRESLYINLLFCSRVARPRGPLPAFPKDEGKDGTGSRGREHKGGLVKSSGKSFVSNVQRYLDVKRESYCWSSAEASCVLRNLGTYRGLTVVALFLEKLGQATM